jgi:hypothetical protein
MKPIDGLREFVKAKQLSFWSTFGAIFSIFLNVCFFLIALAFVANLAYEAFASTSLILEAFGILLVVSLFAAVFVFVHPTMNTPDGETELFEVFFQRSSIPSLTINLIFISAIALTTIVTNYRFQAFMLAYTQKVFEQTVIKPINHQLSKLQEIKPGEYKTPAPTTPAPGDTKTIPAAHVVTTTGPIAAVSAPECIAAGRSGQLECELHYAQDRNIGIVDQFCNAHEGKAVIHIDRSGKYYNASANDIDTGAPFVNNLYLKVVLRDACKETLVIVDNKDSAEELSTPWMNANDFAARGDTLKVPAHTYMEEQYSDGGKVITERHYRDFQPTNENNRVTWRVKYHVEPGQYKVIRLTD